MKNWNWLQNAADLGCFYQCEDCARSENICSIISRNVKYLYEMCDVLVPILHALWRIIGTNSSQCEISEMWILRFNIAQSLMRRRVLRRLIWIYTVCICSFFACFQPVPQVRTLNFRLATPLRRTKTFGLAGCSLISFLNEHACQICVSF